MGSLASQIKKRCRFRKTLASGSRCATIPLASPVNSSDSRPARVVVMASSGGGGRIPPPPPREGLQRSKGGHHGFTLGRSGKVHRREARDQGTQSKHPVPLADGGHTPTRGTKKVLFTSAHRLDRACAIQARRAQVMGCVIGRGAHTRRNRHDFGQIPRGAWRSGPGGGGRLGKGDAVTFCGWDVYGRPDYRQVEFRHELPRAWHPPRGNMPLEQAPIFRQMSREGFLNGRRAKNDFRPTQGRDDEAETGQG